MLAKCRDPGFFHLESQSDLRSASGRLGLIVSFFAQKEEKQIRSSVALSATGENVAKSRQLNLGQR